MFHEFFGSASSSLHFSKKENSLQKIGKNSTRNVRVNKTESWISTSAICVASLINSLLNEIHETYKHEGELKTKVSILKKDFDTF